VHKSLSNKEFATMIPLISQDKEVTMDGELLRHLYHQLFHHSTPHWPRRCNYTDNVVVFVYLLSVVTGRSMRWGYQKRHWPLWARHLRPPSYSQVMRRLQTASVQDYITRMNDMFRDQLPRSSEKVIDGKPLVVGVYSKDPDAKTGCVGEGKWARGYKVHAMIDAGGGVDAAEVTSLNEGEATVALRLMESMDLQGITVRGDANYDSNKLYEAAAKRGGRFLAPRRKPGRSLGHHPQHPHRLQAIAALEEEPSVATAHRYHRNRIEQTFAHLTNLPFGLAPLPNCVRGLARVTHWVKAKILLYHLHLALTRNSAEAA